MTSPPPPPVDDAAKPTPIPDAGLSQEKRAPVEGAPGDRVALVATLCGTALALADAREPVALATGILLGLGGVALALRRRDAARAEPFPTVRALGGLLALAVAAQLAGLLAQLVTSLRLGQLLADGTARLALDDGVRAYARLDAASSWASLALAALFLLGALSRHRR